MTRAMLATTIARFAGETIDGENWAEQGMNWAMENGISDGTNPDGAITRGNPDGSLNPQGSATRAELAAVWMRLIQNVVK